MWYLGKFLPLVIGGAIQMMMRNGDIFDASQNYRYCACTCCHPSVDELAILQGYIEDFLWNLLHLPRKINNSQDALHSSLSGTYLQVYIFFMVILFALFQWASTRFSQAILSIPISFFNYFFQGLAYGAQLVHAISSEAWLF